MKEKLTQKGKNSWESTSEVKLEREFKNVKNKGHTN